MIDNGGDVDTQNIIIRVVDPLGLNVSTRVGEVGRPFSSTLQGTGGTGKFTYSLSGLPAGLRFDNTQTISGTPAARGTATVAVTVKDSDGNTQVVNVPVVIYAKLKVASSVLRAATKGQTYAARLRVTGGARPFRWTAQGLPRGLRLNASTGQLSGHAAAAGTFRVRITVRDALGASATRALALSVH